MAESLQIEFPMRVPVCAWCKPKGRRVDLGTGLGSISHGICPRHLRELKVKLHAEKNSPHPSCAVAGRLRRSAAVLAHPELAYGA